jgi:hypothetical protein
VAFRWLGALLYRKGAATLATNSVIASEARQSSFLIDGWIAPSLRSSQ